MLVETGLLWIGGGSETTLQADAIIVTGLNVYGDERLRRLSLRCRPVTGCTLHDWAGCWLGCGCGC